MLHLKQLVQLRVKPQIKNMKIGRIVNYFGNHKKHIPRAAVIGDPISHSLSPKLHNFWLKKYGVIGSYESVLIKKDELVDKVESMINEFVGFNVTIPHKETIYQLIKLQHGDLTQAALASSAVNTVVIKKNGKLIGDNSDGAGFFKNLLYTQPDFDYKDKNIFIIGAGGAARAIINSAFTDLQARNIFITNRSEDKFKSIYEDFAKLRQSYSQTAIKFFNKSDFEENLHNCDLLINSTSLGMQGQQPLNLNLDKLNKQALVYDIIYKPLMTDLLKQAQLRGNKIVTGIGMLAFQAAVGFEQWFEKKPEIDEELLQFLIKATNN